jgi:peptidyl-prolyl cis-trans isomerase C
VAQDAKTVLATVNGTAITVGHVIAMQTRLPPEYKALEDSVLFNGILDQLIQQQVTADIVENKSNTALRFGYENEMRAYLSNEFIMELNKKNIDEVAIQEIYNKDYSTLPSTQEYKAAHILLTNKIDAINIKKLIDSGNDFSDLAKKESIGPSSPQGGDLGWFGKGAMVPEFEKVVLELKDGEVSNPVQTQFGWHIIKRAESRLRPPPGLEEMRAEIESFLKGASIKEALETAISGADIKRSAISVNPSIIRNVELILSN